MTSRHLVNWQIVYSQLYMSIDNSKWESFTESTMDSRDNPSWIWQLISRQLTSRQSKPEWDIKQEGNSIKIIQQMVWMEVFIAECRCNGQTILLRVAVWGKGVESRACQLYVGRWVVSGGGGGKADFPDLTPVEFICLASLLQNQTSLPSEAQSSLHRKNM